jgi:hypothetical protein
MSLRLIRRRGWRRTGEAASVARLYSRSMTASIDGLFLLRCADKHREACEGGGIRAHRAEFRIVLISNLAAY